MDAVEYVKELRRMCKMQKICNGCPLRNNGTCIAGLCDDGLCDEAEKAVQIVEKWAKDNPVKTRQSEFLKKFPNAMINKSDGVLCITPCSIEGESIGCINGKSCGDCRREYWSEEVNN